MANETPNNPSKPQQSQGKTNASTGASSRADQPTPVSGASQSQGSQAPSGNQSNQGKPSTTTDLKQMGNELAGQAKEAVSSATDQVKSQVSDLSQAAQEQASSFLGDQKDMAAQSLGGVAQALRHAGQELADNDQSTLAQYTDSLAGQIDNFSNSLRDREIGSLLEDAKQLAYRQPEWFVAGALAAGFALGRFFKSSRSRSQQNNYLYAYQGRYDEYNSRGDNRNYGQPYGDPYSRTGPDYSRGYDSGQYRPQSGSPYENQYRNEYGAQYSNPAGSTSSPRPVDQWGDTRTPSSGQVTTPGVSSGQNPQRQAELQRNRNVAQTSSQTGGQTQSSSYQGSGVTSSSNPANRPNQSEEQRDEGESK